MEIKGIYRHFKGNNYEVIGEATDNFSRKYIFYRQLYSPFSFWIRPKNMFFGYKYDGSRKVKRFTRITDSQGDCLSNINLNEIEINHSETGLKYKIIGRSDGMLIIEEYH